MTRCKDHGEEMIEVSVRVGKRWVSRDICPVCDHREEQLAKDQAARIERMLADELLGVCSREDY